MSGLEKDVPSPEAILPDDVTTTLPCPNAETSGLTRPSELGPTELNAVRAPAWSTAPQAITPSASAGTTIYFHDVAPSLPAAFTTRIPRSNALCAARETTDVLP